MNREQVVQGVRECVADVLDVGVDGIGEQQQLIGELGADSLDLLDLLFRLERRFQVKVTPRDIERRAQQRLGGQPLEVDGTYTEAALVELRAALPEVPAAELGAGLQVAELPRRFRVATFVNLVVRLLDEQRGPGSSGPAARGGGR